jgi:hypothetical protein
MNKKPKICHTCNKPIVEELGFLKLEEGVLVRFMCQKCILKGKGKEL